MKKILYYLNIVVILPFYLIGKCFYGVAIVCNFLMDKLDFRYELMYSDEEDDGQRFDDDD